MKIQKLLGVLLIIALGISAVMITACESDDRPIYIFDLGDPDPNPDPEPEAPITIDGDHSDWDDIAVLAERVGEDGILLEIKAISDKDNIYFYLKGDDTFYGFIQMYLNADGDPATGWNWDRHADDAGAEWELDATASDGEMYPFIGEDGDGEWNFEGEPLTGNEFYTGSEASGNAMEFSLARAFISNLASTISFSLGDVDLGADGEGWDEHGALPSEGIGFAQLELE